MVKQERVINTFCDLVKIDSESGEEEQVALWLKNKLKDLDLEVDEDEAGRKLGSNAKGNLIARKKGTNRQKETLLFSAHMDTVKPGKGIKPQIKNGTIYSDGTTILGGDDKAGIAAILEALEVVKEKHLDHGDLEVVLTLSEEIGLLGSKNLDFPKLKAKKGYILDSGGPTGTIIVQAPYHLNLKVKVLGKSAHSGVNPEDGINAIQVAAMVLARLPLGRIDEETTSNFGVIKGGRATNIVPDYVELEGEIRSLNENKLKKAEELFRAIFLQVTKEQKADLEWKTQLEYKGFQLTEEDSVVALAIRAAKEFNLEYALKSRGGGSDANVFNNEGQIPAVNLGVGLSKDHTVEESLRVEDLVNTASYLVQIIGLAEEKND